jgi:glycosyltransferase involved in cell wall biosynthesis
MASPSDLPDSAPLVSVCIPVYNGEAHLAEALASVLRQGYRNLEILVFDDASSDGSPGILAGIQDPRLSLHRNEANLGPEGNWNRALEAARGTYVKLFHQDDLLEPDCLARQVAALEAEPDAVLAFCGRRIIRSDGKLLLARRPPWGEGRVTARQLVDACVKAGTNLVGEPSAVLFRRSAALKAGRFDASIPYLVDLDYWLRLVAYGPAWCMRETLASFRVSPRQWSAAIGRKQSGQFIAFLDRLQDRMEVRIGRVAKLRGRWMAILNGWIRALVYRTLAGGR